MYRNCVRYFPESSSATKKPPHQTEKCNVLCKQKDSYQIQWLFNHFDFFGALFCRIRSVIARGIRILKITDIRCEGRRCKRERFFLIYDAMKHLDAHMNGYHSS
jgi:hypothetical protein